MVEDLLTKETAEVHIQNAAFINKPSCRSQMDQWVEEYLQEYVDADRLEVEEAIIDNDTPQDEHHRKRRRRSQ